MAVRRRKSDFRRAAREKPEAIRRRFARKNAQLDGLILDPRKKNLLEAKFRGRIDLTGASGRAEGPAVRVFCINCRGKGAQCAVNAALNYSFWALAFLMVGGIVLATLTW